jgi:predicted nucleic acid-binding protein
MIFAGASFLVALFVERDKHWREAWKWWRQRQGPVITVTRFSLFEAAHTMRGLVVARLCRAEDSQHALEGLERAQREGFIISRRIPEHQLFPHAERLSQFHTLRATCGAMDILHVAAAPHLGAAAFL